jgi:hypothetical protein
MIVTPSIGLALRGPFCVDPTSRRGFRDPQAAERLLCNLVDREAAEGTPLETVLGRLPPDLAQALRLQFGVILAEEKSLRARGGTGACSGVRR